MSENNFAVKFQRAQQTIRQVVGEMMQLRNVVACGVGIKAKGGQSLGEPCLVVSVTRKRRPEELNAEDLIPRLIDDVLTDVIETGEILAHSYDRRALMRPVRPGVSLAHRDGTAGTLACVVQRGDQRFALSCNHVLANLNAGQIGDPIYQPGPADGGAEASTFAQLAGFIPLRFIEGGATASASAQSAEPQGCAAILSSLLKSGGSSSPAQPQALNNEVDCAIAQPLPGIFLNPEIIDVGGAPIGVARPTLNMQIVKSGRTTGLTQGRVTQMDVTVDVKFGMRTARFTNQVFSSRMSEPGDSGSLVLDYQRNAVGLLFSGSSSVSVFSPIGAVLQALQVELVTEPA